MKEIGVALTGEMRSGKDVTAKYLEEQYGFMPFAFGDNLKKGFHYTYSHIHRDPKPVRGYQLYGQLMRYVHGDDYWIDQCFSDINYGKMVAHGYSLVPKKYEFRPVITDMRQPNEFDRCKEEGFITIRIEAPLEARLERIKAAGDDFDPNNLKFETETHIKNFKVDHIIKNYRDLQYLYDQVDFYMKQYGITKK